MSVMGSMDDYRRAMNNGVTDFTKNGKCSNCGECCTDMLPMSDADIRSVRAFLAHHHVDEHLHVPPTATPVIDNTCPFRDDLKRVCEIYPARPAVCRTFQCNGISMEGLYEMAKSNEKYEIKSMRKTFFGR